MLAQRRALVRTTDFRERISVRVRCRTCPIRCFVNQASLERILFAVLCYFSRRGASNRLRLFTHNT